MPAKAKLRQIPPKSIKVPDVRVTSVWDPELLGMLRDSIKVDGIQAPLILVQEGKDLWLVDGLHRLEEAKLQDAKTVPCAVIPGTLKDVMLKNLYMNRLRGSTKASEMVKVIGALRNVHGLGIEEMAKKTGMKRDYIERMIQASKATGEVLEALDREEISVSHAFQIARVESRDVQLRLLGQVFTYRLAAKDLKDVVNETLEILKKRSELPTPTEPPPLKPIPTVRCHVCEQEMPIRKVVGVNMCVGCYGLAVDYIKKLKKAGEDLTPKPEKIAEIVVKEPIEKKENT